MNKIRISSTGRAGQTHVYVVNETTGEEVEMDMVRSVTWQLDAQGEGLGVALIEVMDVGVDLAVDPENCDVSTVERDPVVPED